MEPFQQVAEYEEKLRNLLELIRSPNFRFTNDCYLNSLLSHLAGKENKEFGERLLRAAVITNWIPESLSYWEWMKLPSVAISSFFLNLTALVSGYEETFLAYNDIHVYDRLFDMFNVYNADIQKPTLKLSYVKILSGLLKHKSGRDWVISNDVWKLCLNYCLENETLYIIREGHNFIYNLIVYTLDTNEAFANTVVQEIYSKLTIPETTDNKLFPEIADEALEKKLTPTIKLVTFILNELIQKENYKRNNCSAVFLLTKTNALEELVNNLKTVCRNGNLVYAVYAILIYIKILNVLVNPKNDTFEVDVLFNNCSDIMKYISELLSVRHIATVIKLCHLADSLWNYLPADRMPATLSAETGRREPLRFQNQLIVFQITPIFGICFVHISSYKFDGDDLREDFIATLLRMLHEKTIRMGYNWRDVLQSQKEGFEMAKFATRHLLQSIDNYNKSRAIMVFQVLLYTLKDILTSLKIKPNLCDLFVANSSFMISCFETMASFIDKFELTWRDSVETICVMNNAIECINQTWWPPRVIVQALKLVDLSIEKFLPPDLALLVEEDSTTSMLGNMLSTKLYDVNWEIRDTTLEILHTIAKISNTKYPLFQAMLIKLEIIPIIVKMTMSDGDCFVRASAIKCLQELIQVQEIWTQVLITHELPQKMIHILQHETESVVRTEAAKLMANIHTYQSFQKELMPQIYASMAFVASRDFHWEVKSNALDFWGKVVLNHLQEQGYIDNKFPDVTFSKEKRKIVKLTEGEVQQRLNKVLGQLGEIGCLGVLFHAFQDDCDIEVCKKALTKVKRMKAVLETHNLFDCYKNVTLPAPEAPLVESVGAVPSTVQFCDSILDDILSTNDVDLLPTYLKRSEGDGMPSLYPEDTHEVLNALKAITPEVFIAFLEKNLDEIIDEKVKWLNKMDTFDTLLNDMLCPYLDDINTMDCY